MGGSSSATWGSPARAYSAGYDAFAAKLDTEGEMIFTRYLGIDSGFGHERDVGRDALKLFFPQLGHELMVQRVVRDVAGEVLLLEAV